MLWLLLSPAKWETEEHNHLLPPLITIHPSSSSCSIMHRSHFIIWALSRLLCVAYSSPSPHGRNDEYIFVLINDFSRNLEKSRLAFRSLLSLGYTHLEAPAGIAVRYDNISMRIRILDKVLERRGISSRSFWMTYRGRFSFAG
jgi:hypothetical protein